ncbi:hypothetical protein C8R44DRAFT_732681 [Mycena epipterygia]|nr:hypothetical protein C8R44DRAFT_732681 [Mycena epipterygia]
MAFRVKLRSYRLSHVFLKLGLKVHQVLLLLPRNSTSGAGVGSLRMRASYVTAVEAEDVPRGRRRWRRVYARARRDGGRVGAYGRERWASPRLDVREKLGTGWKGQSWRYGGDTRAVSREKCGGADRLEELED